MEGTWLDAFGIIKSQQSHLSHTTTLFNHVVPKPPTTIAPFVQSAIVTSICNEGQVVRHISTIVAACSYSVSATRPHPTHNIA